ncbi:MAG: pyruvate kinase [Candidatus Omnitrophota bacterium]
MVNTKIVSTLGPASSNETMLRKMFLAGVDVVRLNFSHGTHPEHMSRIRIIRTLNKKMRRAIKIMQDLEGYRIRVGSLPKPLELKKNSIIYIAKGDSPRAGGNEASFDYRGPLKDIRNGTLIYIDDGRIVLEVRGRDSKRLKLKVLVAGLLKENKGINMPGCNITFPAVTDKDRFDIKVAIREKLDYVAQSFVQKGDDIRALRSLLGSEHPGCRIFAKVENAAALKNLDDIIDESDGIIVARGDLGVCIPIYKVPVIQKEIIKKCNRVKKPVIVATQMLESMVDEPLPTRAEVSDVANAILDGATHLMLSGETAVGRHPHKVVNMMNMVIKNTESYQRKLKSLLE